jgi:hypothetical protein
MFFASVDLYLGAVGAAVLCVHVCVCVCAWCVSVRVLLVHVVRGSGRAFGIGYRAVHKFV